MDSEASIVSALFRRMPRYEQQSGILQGIFIVTTGQLAASRWLRSCASPSRPSARASITKLSVDAKLFIRTQRCQADEREKLLYSYVKSGLDDIWYGENGKADKDLDTGEVRIGASDMTLQFYLLPFLERFHEKYPKVKVTVSNGPTPETLGF